MAAEVLTFPGSSYLAGGTYDPETKELAVLFVNGGGARHQPVPQTVVDNLKAHGGAYYRSAIYGRYGSVSV